MDHHQFDNITNAPKGDGCFKSFLVIGGGFAVLITVIIMCKYFFGL